MTKVGKIAGILIATLTVALVASLIALFHGYFDQGKFEILDAQRSTSGQIAMLAERSDHQAMSSCVHFVVVGDHLFSANELRHAYHSSAVIFSAAAECLTLRWTDAQQLTVTCSDGSLDKDHINSQKSKNGNVDVSYVNIPN